MVFYTMKKYLKIIKGQTVTKNKIILKEKYINVLIIEKMKILKKVQKINLSVMLL